MEPMHTAPGGSGAEQLRKVEIGRVEDVCDRPVDEESDDDEEEGETYSESDILDIVDDLAPEMEQQGEAHIQSEASNDEPPHISDTVTQPRTLTPVSTSEQSEPVVTQPRRRGQKVHLEISDTCPEGTDAYRKLTDNQNDPSVMYTHNFGASVPEQEAPLLNTPPDQPQQEVPIRLSPLQEQDDDAARWLVYKRIFVSDAYNLAMDNIFSLNFGCMMIAALCLGYNLVGLIKAVFFALLGMPLVMVIICRTLILWRLVLRSGPDIRTGMYEYWNRSNKSRSIFTAKYKDKVIGTVALVALSPHVAEISRVAVDRDCVCQGVGTCIMRYVLKLADDNGFEEILLTVSESNYPACVLFEKFGFRVTRDVSDTFYKVLKWKGYLMRLRLRSPEGQTPKQVTQRVTHMDSVSSRA